MPDTKKIDWLEVRVDYEQGASKQALSLKYNVSRQAILKRARKEHWVPLLVPSPEHFVPSPVTSSQQLSTVETDETDELSEQDIVHKALHQLATFLEDDGLLTLNQHKLFADALSQYIKLKMLLPQQGDTEENYGQYDLREFLAGCTDEELAIVRPVIAAVAQRKQEADEKVKPMRKIG